MIAAQAASLFPSALRRWRGGCQMRIKVRFHIRGSAPDPGIYRFGGIPDEKKKRGKPFQLLAPHPYMPPGGARVPSPDCPILRTGTFIISQIVARVKPIFAMRPEVCRRKSPGEPCKRFFCSPGRSRGVWGKNRDRPNLSKSQSLTLNFDPAPLCRSRGLPFSLSSGMPKKAINPIKSDFYPIFPRSLQLWKLF